MQIAKLSEVCSENFEDGRRSIPPRIPRIADDYHITVRDMYYLPLDRINNCFWGCYCQISVYKLCDYLIYICCTIGFNEVPEISWNLRFRE